MFTFNHIFFHPSILITVAVFSLPCVLLGSVLFPEKPLAVSGKNKHFNSGH